MSERAPAVAVVIVTYNSQDVIEGCLESLEEVAGSLRCDVYVVDNGSTDLTTTLVAACAPGAALIRMGRNAGYAAAINAASQRLQPHQHLLVLNPDVRLHGACLPRLVEDLGLPGVGIVAPRLTDADGQLQLSIRRDPSVSRAFGEAILGGRRAGRFPRLGEVESRRWRYLGQQDADWVTGAALLISDRCRTAVGRWDETFFLYSEETDYCQRARRAGWLVRYDGDASATHLGGDLSSSPYLRAVLLRSKLLLVSRNAGWLRASAYRTALLLHEAVRAFRGSPTHRAGLAHLLGRPVVLPTADA